MKKFKLSDEQAEAILELRLRQLAKLEEMKIRGEQKQLAQERDVLARTLKSRVRMKTLMREELQADADQFGDVRRSPLRERGAARAIDQAALIPTEPVTVIISQRGWVRAAKGHELEPRDLKYRSGDGYLQAACGRTNQLLVFIDGAGRTYGMVPHNLPSVRSQGEPLSSMLNPSAGTGFAGVMMGDAEDLFFLATSHAYGFVARLGDLHTKNRTGKASLKVPSGARIVLPCPVRDFDEHWLALASNEGRMLVFMVGELPQLARGRGVKLMNIPAKRAKEGVEYLAGACVFEEGDRLTLLAGKRHLNMRPADIDHYLGERALRGLMLPKGFRQVAGLEVQRK